MNLHYLIIDYDKYWHQLVFGYGVYKLGQCIKPWPRLFGLGKAKH